MGVLNLSLITNQEKRKQVDRMKEDWSLTKDCKEISLAEYDADIYHWDKKVGETIEIELCQRLMIPENSIRTKGMPRYFRAVRTSDIETLRRKLIDDIEEELIKISNYCDTSVNKERLVKKVNKRFMGKTTP